MADFGANEPWDFDPISAACVADGLNPAEFAFPPEPPDAVAPITSNVSPPNLSQIGRTTPVFLDVTDNLGLLRRVIIHAKFTTHWEVVHDGDGFSPLYSGLSSRTAIANGFRYRAQRTGGWPSAPTLVAHAIDETGNEATA